MQHTRLVVSDFELSGSRRRGATVEPPPPHPNPTLDNDERSGACLHFIGSSPAPGTGSEATSDDPLAEDIRDLIPVSGQQCLRRAHLGAEGQLAFRQTVAPVLVELCKRAVGLGPSGTEGTLIHLAAAAEVARLRELRGPEGTGIEAIATADAEILGMQHQTLFGLVEAVHGADRHAGRVRAVHAGDRDRTFARLAVIDGYHPAAVDTPGHLVLVLACRDTGVALDATLGITEKLHACHLSSPLLIPSSSALDLAQGDFRFLHLGHNVIAIGCDRIRALTQDVGVTAAGVLRPQVLAHPVAGEVEGHEGHSTSHALGDEGHHLDAHWIVVAVVRAINPDLLPIPNAAVIRIEGVDLDEHVLLQLGEPGVGPGLVASPLVFDQTAGREDDGEALREVLVLDRLEEHRQTHAVTVLVGRVVGHESTARRIERLAMKRYRIREVPDHRPGLGVAIGRTAMLDGYPLDAAGVVDLPVDCVDVAILGRSLDGSHLLVRQILVPTERLEQ